MLSVKKRQTYLKELGFYKGKIDGIAGKQTKQAYRDLQNKYFTRKKDRDGLYGNDTDKLLVNAYNVHVYAPNFKLEEFKCQCKGLCTGYPEYISVTLLKQAQKVRNKYGATTIRSGLRCTKHNANVGGVRGSRHVLGKAIDFYNSGCKTAANRKDTIDWLIKHLTIRYAYANGYARTKTKTTYPKVPTMGNSIHLDVL